MQEAGIGEVTARARPTENKDGFSDQFSEKRKRHVRSLSAKEKDERIYLTSQQQFGNECLEVYDAIFGQIQWRFEKLREVCDVFNCVTSESLAVKSAEKIYKSAADLAFKYNDDINGAEILYEVESFQNFNVQ